METITIVMFLIVFAITIVFSAFAIQLEDEIWAFLSMVLWFALGLLNIDLMYQVEPMFYAFSLFYFAVGIVFFVLGWKFLLGSLSFKREQREMELR